GSVTTNLKVMSVINLPYNKFHEMDFFRISCMFQHKNAYYKDYLEGIIVKLIIDRKNTRKRFLT
ncbi:TPA: PilZ domain-containing protein, partial [Klebsiella variicola subsp. variicola]